MGSIEQLGSNQAARPAERKKALQELQQRNRTLADARVQLTRMRRQLNAIEQQFDEVSRAAQQWLEQARLYAPEDEAKALGYLRRHNAAALQLSALIQRIERKSASLVRRQRDIQALETRLQAAIQRFKCLTVDASEQLGRDMGPPNLALSTLFEPWELRFEGVTEQNPHWSAGAGEDHDSQTVQNDQNLIEQLAALLDTDH